MKEELKRDSTIIYRSYRDAIAEMPPKEFKRCMMAILNYALDGIEPETNGIEQIIFAMTKPQIDKNNQRYLNSKSGGRKPKESQPETEAEPSENVSETKAEQNDNQGETEAEPSDNQTETKAEQNENQSETKSEPKVSQPSAKFEPSVTKFEPAVEPYTKEAMEAKRRAVVRALTADYTSEASSRLDGG
ncbi:MAG: DUF6291 domain-containing protein [Clostridiales bacterium]|nr:DUF6291 domain-containing protein [Clostridiales bacterium]